MKKEKLKELIEKELNRKILEEAAKVTKARLYRDVRYTKFLVIYFVVFALGIASIYFTFNYTGFFTFTEENLTQDMSYTDVLNLEINQSQEYNWTLENFCNLENCTLKSISISGHVIANQSGNINIFIENFGKQYLVFNKNFELNKTIISQNITVEQNITFVNETTNETYIQTVNTTQEVNITVEQPEVFYFNDSCIETCNLTDVFNKGYYNLRFDLAQNISLMLYSIRYSLVIERGFEFKPEENTTTLPPTTTTMPPTTITMLLATQEVSFDRVLDCHKCGQHKAPPLTGVNMTITAAVSSPVNGVFADYYPVGWLVLDPNGGSVSSFNSSYNRIEWNVEATDSVSRWYSISSPALTSPPTKYYFFSEIAGIQSDLWQAIVSDPSSGPSTVGEVGSLHDWNITLLEAPLQTPWTIDAFEYRSVHSDAEIYFQNKTFYTIDQYAFRIGDFWFRNEFERLMEWVNATDSFRTIDYITSGGNPITVNGNNVSYGEVFDYDKFGNTSSKGWLNYTIGEDGYGFYAKEFLQFDTREEMPTYYSDEFGLKDENSLVLRSKWNFDQNLTVVLVLLNGSEVVWDKTTSYFAHEIRYEFAGQTVFRHFPVYAKDSADNITYGLYHVSFDGSKFWLSKLISYGWLRNAVYPVVIDPSTVSSATVADTNGPLRNVIKVGGYWFVFYARTSDSYLVYKSSSDGTNWGAESTASHAAVSNGNPHEWTVYTNGTTIMIAYPTGTYSTASQTATTEWSRTGTQSGGTISWNTQVQVRQSCGYTVFGIVKTANYWWLAVEFYFGATQYYNLTIYRSADDGASWTTSIFNLKTADPSNVGNQGGMLLVNGTGGTDNLLLITKPKGPNTTYTKCYYRKYNSGSWDAADSTFGSNVNFYHRRAISAVYYNNEVHFVHTTGGENGGTIYYDVWNGASWTSDATVDSGPVNMFETLSAYPDNLYLFYIAGTTIYYRKMGYSSHTWDSAATTFASGETSPSGLNSEQYPSLYQIGVTWRAGSASPYDVRFDFLDFSPPSPPTYSLNSTNSTMAGTAVAGAAVNHSLNWTAGGGTTLSGYVFSFYNGSDTTYAYNWTSPDQEGNMKQFNTTAAKVNTSATPTQLIPSITTNTGVTRTFTEVVWTGGTSTALTDANYNALNTSNQVNVSNTGGSTSLDAGICVNFTMPANSGINWIWVNIEMAAEVAKTDQGLVAAYNWTNSAWQNLTATTGLMTYNEWNATKNITNTDVTKFVTGGKFWLCGRTYGLNNVDMHMDFMRLIVGYNVTSYTPNTEQNSTWTGKYDGIDGNDYQNVDKVGVIINVSNYNPSASNSTYGSNNRPYIEIGFYNGTSYVNNTYCQVNATAGNNLPNNTAQNCSVNVTNNGILAAWKYQANRSVIIRGIFLDAYNTTIFDEVNVTGIYGYVDGSSSLSLTNDTWVAFGSDTWSNVTKTVNFTAGANISWCVYANDSSNSWNGTSCANPFTYTTTEPPAPSLAGPQWSANSTRYATPVAYDPAITHGFQVTWTAGNGFFNTTNVTFEANFTGTMANYTNATTPALFNRTASTFIINFTNTQFVNASKFAYRWFAANGTGAAAVWNVTSSMGYNVTKAASNVSLWLNDTASNKSYTQNQVANFTAFLNVSDKTIYLDSNYTGWVLQTGTNSVIYNTTNLTTTGNFWNLTAYWNGDTNYTSSSQTYFFNVTIPTVSISLSNSPVNFGNIIISQSNNTLDDSPLPFLVDNTGDVDVNVTIYAANLWNTVSNPTNDYQFECGTGGTSCAPGSVATFTNMPHSDNPTTVIAYLTYSYSNKVHINITSPAEEDPASRSSIVTFIASQA